MNSIELRTRDGRALTIADTNASECSACDVTVVEAAALCDVTMRDHAGIIELELALCGGCIAEGVAIMLGRRHVQAGGSLRDLG